MDDTVDGSEIPNNHLGCIELVANNGISTTNFPDSWTINSMGSEGMIMGLE